MYSARKAGYAESISPVSSFAEKYALNDLVTEQIHLTTADVKAFSRRRNAYNVRTETEQRRYGRNTCVLK
jgi:hypothetical protein